jgi:hypothetical protein
MMQLSLDVIQDWLSKWSFNSMDLVDTAGYAPYQGLESLRTVSKLYLLYLFLILNYSNAVKELY